MRAVTYLPSEDPVAMEVASEYDGIDWSGMFINLDFNNKLKSFSKYVSNSFPTEFILPSLPLLGSC
jgi:hypothetical protein